MSTLKRPRIILLDIESLPIADEVLMHLTSMGDYPGRTLKASINSVLCVGWKVLGQKRVHCINAWDFGTWKKNVNDDRELLMATFDVIKDADVVVTHNGKRFDWRFIQTRLRFHSLPPLPPIIHIDTCQESKKHLFMYDNRLNTLAKAFTTTKKLENGGWPLWMKVMKRDAKSMRLMEKYCKQDVAVLEKVFEALRPLIRGLPNANIMNGTSDNCPSCGGNHLHRRGLAFSAGQKFHRAQCVDCGFWARLTPRGART